MAESTSFFPNLGLLSDKSLIGLGSDVSDALQRDATKRLVIGSLLGRPDVGFSSAMGLPSEYTQNQSRLIQLQKEAEDRAAAERVGKQFFPSATDAAERAMSGELNTGRVGPTLQAAQAQRQILEAPIDFTQAYGAVGRLGQNAAAPNIRESLKLIEPKIGEGGVRTGPGGVYMGTVPQISTSQGLVTGISVDKQGNIVPYGSALPGAVEQRAALTTAEKGATAQFDFEKVKGPDGTEYLVPKSQLANWRAQQPGATQPAAQPSAQPAKPAAQPGLASQIPGLGPQDIAPKPNALVSNLGPAAQAVQGAYKPILDDAYAGYKTASGRSGTLQSLQNTLNKQNFDTNAFTGAKTQMIALMNAAGIADDKQKQYLNSSVGMSQALNAIAAQSVSELPGAISNFELNFSQKRFATINDPKDANRYAIDLMSVADDRKKAYYEFVRNNPSADVITKWEQSKQGSTSLFEDSRLRKYLPQVQITSGEYKGKTAYQMPNGTYKYFQ